VAVKRSEAECRLSESETSSELDENEGGFFKWLAARLRWKLCLMAGKDCPTTCPVARLANNKDPEDFD